MTQEVTFNPNPVQREFIESHSKADLFSSRMGEGKSAGLCWASFYHMRHNPGAFHAFIRDTWENLRDTTLQEFFKWFPPGQFGTWNESKKTYTWSSGVGEGKVKFLGMDDPNDAGALQSRPLGAFFIDEPAPAAQSGGVPELVFDIGLSRLRQEGMNWYAAKLATNNPDETHWTFRRFVDPGTDGFVVHQTVRPENERNLPAGYYEELRRLWSHNQNLVDRFVEGKYGAVQVGKAVTPEWADELHLATGLFPIKGCELYLLWDFGLNPTCIITQITPLRQWLILDAMVGEDMGVQELIDVWVKPVLADRYKGFRWKHIVDPAGKNREQSSANQSALKVIRKELGGNVRLGPIPFASRAEPLRAILRQTLAGGRGVVQVDRQRAKAVWQSLKGGWHYHVARTGVVSTDPVKDIHSHPGDAMGYGAAILFPIGKLQQQGRIIQPKHANFFGGESPSFIGKPGLVIPKEGRVILPGGR